MRTLLSSVSIILLLFSFITTSHSQTLRIALKSNDLAGNIFEEVIKRNSQYSVAYQYDSNSYVPLNAVINQVENNALDLFWTMTTPEYEKRFLAIRIPIYRGILGMRLAIIRKQSAPAFAKIKTIEQMKKFTAVSGTYWADTGILESNHIPVVKEHKYSNMFRMLEAERFDYFPRGMHEPWGEVDQHTNLNLMVEPNVMLWYKVPFYFFVQKDNTRQANTIESTLESMIDDGRFIELFYNDSQVNLGLSKSNLEHRIIFKLDNRKRLAKLTFY